MNEARDVLKSRIQNSEEILLAPPLALPSLFELSKTDELLKAQMFEAYKVDSMGAAEAFYNANR